LQNAEIVSAERLWAAELDPLALTVVIHYVEFLFFSVATLEAPK